MYGLFTYMKGEKYHGSQKMGVSPIVVTFQLQPVFTSMIMGRRVNIPYMSIWEPLAEEI